MDTVMLIRKRTSLTDDHQPWPHAGIIPHPDAREKTMIHEMARELPHHELFRMRAYGQSPKFASGR